MPFRIWARVSQFVYAFRFRCCNLPSRDSLFGAGKPGWNWPPDRL